MYWKNEQTTAKESPSKNTVSVSDTLACVHFFKCLFMHCLFLSATLILQAIILAINKFGYRNGLLWYLYRL